MVPPLYAVNNMIRRAKEQKTHLTHLKIQKLLYILNARFYYEAYDSLFQERFEAWQHGPVLTSIYDVFESEDSNAISELRPDANGKIFVVSEKNGFGSAFDFIWDKYSKKSAAFLVDMTHGKNDPDHETAWKIAYDKFPGAYLSNKDIINDGKIWFGKERNG